MKEDRDREHGGEKEEEVLLQRRDLEMIKETPRDDGGIFCGGISWHGNRVNRLRSEISG